MTKPLLVPAELTRAPNRRLDHFLWVARHAAEFPDYQIQKLRIVPEGLVRPLVRPDESTYGFLAWLLTGERAFAERAKNKLLEVADSVAEREQGDWTQMHCWCDAFPFARWIVLADWVWDSDVFSKADRDRLTERLLYYAWAHPYQRLRARPIEYTPGNNQNAAMAFTCTAAGYLFSVKRGNDPRAKKLLAFGLPHVVKFLTAFPRGGYSFEGSTYMGGVNAFILPLALALVQAVTGEDLLDCRESADCATPREVLHAIIRLCSPSGLLLPWDNYGYSRADFTAPAAYLAYRTGDRGPLEFLESLGALERPAHTGWGFDQHLWTTMWMLATTTRSANRGVTLNHAEPTIGAGAHGPAQRLYAYQMWDRSHWPPSRAQFNPNSLVMEFAGAPLLVDGRLVEKAKAARFEKPEYRFFRGDINAEANFGGGTVGAHNCLVFDDEDHYCAPESTEGKLVAAWYGDGAACFEADVTNCYRYRYDVQTVRRAMLMLGDDCVLVRDRVVSATPHKITWRAHVRAGEVGGNFRVVTPDHVQLEVCVPGNQPIAYQHCVGNQTDTQLEGSCHEVSHHAHGQDLTLSTLLVPTARLQTWKALDQHWQFRGQPVDFRNSSRFYTTDHHEPGIDTYRCEFDVDAIPAGGVWLRLPHLTRSTTVRVNSQEFRIDIAPEKVPLLPALIEIGNALRPGRNLLELVVPTTLETALCGKVSLLTPAPALPAAKLVQRDNGTLELHHHGKCDVVEWREDGCTVRRADGSVITIPLTSAPAAVAAVCDRRLPEIVDAHRAPLQVDEIMKALRSPDWRVVLPALEDAEGATAAGIIDAAWQILQREAREHETLPTRQPDDVGWYRLKATAARVLGAARYEPATELLGKILLGPDMYPARMACAWALGQIATPRAIELLKQVPAHDEFNTMVTARRWAAVKGRA